jgi:hypothetical protein
MGLRQVSGKKVPVNYALDRQVNVKDPVIAVYRDGKAQTSVRCVDLLSVTGVTDPAMIQRVITAAAAVPEETPWTKDHVTALCEQTGRLPFPKYVRVEHLEGQATLLVNVVHQEGPGVTELSYPKGTNRPSFNILPALKDEQIQIPVGMCLEVPVSLVLDEGVLKVEFCLRKGVERALRTRDAGGGSAGAQGK